MDLFANIPAEAAAIIFTLNNAGYTAYFCGGCVRDALLGRNPKDYDIVTNARPGDIEKLFSRTIPVGKSFGTIVVVCDSGNSYEVSTFNKGHGHAGKFIPASPREDAERRDFTINALFLDIIEDKLIDHVNGQLDIAQRTLRTCRDADTTFADDELRMLRAFRFIAELGDCWSLGDDVQNAIIHRVQNLADVSSERIAKEIDQILISPNPGQVFEMLHDYRLLAVILPEVDALWECNQNHPNHPEVNLWKHTALMLRELRHRLCDFTEEDLLNLSWAVLLHDIGKPATANDDCSHFYGHAKVGAAMALNICQRLKKSKERTDIIVGLVANHMSLLEAHKMRLAKRRRIMQSPTFPLLLELLYLDCMGSNNDVSPWEYMRSEWEVEKDRKPAPRLITGQQVMELLGMKPGKEIGEILKMVEDAVLEDQVKTEVEAIEFIKRLKNQDFRREPKLGLIRL